MELGEFRRKQKNSLIYSKTSNALIVLFLTYFVFFSLFRAGLCFADLNKTFSMWKKNASWVLNASFKNTDGEWSDPFQWSFEFILEDQDSILIRAKRLGLRGGETLLDFDKQCGYLKKVVLKDIFKKREVVREMTIEQISPVYPLFSNAPFYFPVLFCQSEKGDYNLERSMNGRKIGSEAIEQVVEKTNMKSLPEDMPEKGKTDLKMLGISSEGTRISVSKKGTNLFRQYWFPGFPWAVYTETQKSKIWFTR